MKVKYEVSYQDVTFGVKSLKDAFEVAKAFSQTLPNSDNGKEHNLSSFRKHIQEYTEINIYLGEGKVINILPVD